MGIGMGLFLIAIGAVLAFGLHIDNLGWVSINVVGWILMLTGLIGTLLTFTIWRPYRRRLVARRQPVEDETEPQEERRWVYDQEPPPV